MLRGSICGIYAQVSNLMILHFDFNWQVQSHDLALLFSVRQFLLLLLQTESMFAFSMNTLQSTRIRYRSVFKSFHFGERIQIVAYSVNTIPSYPAYSYRREVKTNRFCFVFDEYASVCCRRGLKQPHPVVSRYIDSIFCNVKHFLLVNCVNMGHFRPNRSRQLVNMTENS